MKRRIFIAVLAVSTAALAILWSSALIPFVIGLITAYLLDPLVGYAQHKLKMQRLPALLLVFVLFLLLFLFIFMSIVPLLIQGVSAITYTLGSNRDAISGFIEDSINWFDGLELPIDHEALMSKVVSELENFLTQLFSAISLLVLSVIESIPLLIIIPLIVFYLLKDKERIFTVLKRYIRDENEARIYAFFKDIDSRLGGYLKGQFLLSVLVTIITFIALLIFGTPYALLIALANGILNIIPYFGPVIGAVPAVVLDLIHFSSTGHLVAIIIFFVVMNILVSALISPKIFASATNLHPILVLLAIFIGSHAMGMIGMIVAVPLAIVAQTLIRAVFEKYIKEI